MAAPSRLAPTLEGMSALSTLRTSGQILAGWGFITYHAWGRRDPVADLFTFRGRRNPYATYEKLRARGPVSRTTLGGLVTVEHDLCGQVLRERRFGVGEEPGLDGIVDLSLLELDPQDHTRLRRLVAPAFSPRRMKTQEERIQRVVDRLIDDLAVRLKDGPVDLMSTYAKPLPIAMIASLMGIPDEELPALGRHGDAIGGVLDGVQSFGHFRRVRRARADLDTLFLQLAERRRQEPAEDIVGDLVVALDAGELSEAEFRALCSLVLVAGFETTVNLIGNAMDALMNRPEVWRRLTEDPALVDALAEETLRWDSPVQATSRTARADLEVNGHVVPKGTLMLVLIGGANRDPKVFERPDEFDIDRPNAHEHLAFGQGIHHCVGRPLAMLEGRIALRTLAERLPELRRAAPSELGTGMILRGRSRLPVRI